MGKTRGLYNAEFPKGTWVRIASRAMLERFANTWDYHHPLEKKQFDYAGKVSQVVDLGYYHAGAEIYELRGVPGRWHEVCLARANPPRKPRPAKKRVTHVKRKAKAATKPKKARRHTKRRRRKS